MKICIIITIVFLFSCHHEKQPSNTLQNEEEVSELLLTLNDQYAEALESSKADQCLSMMTPDYINYLTYHDTQNRQAVDVMFHQIAQNMKLENVKFTRTEIFIHDDMAYEFGYFTQDITPKNGGEIQTSRARYITVFKKINDKWLFHRWMPQPEIN